MGAILFLMTICGTIIAAILLGIAFWTKKVWLKNFVFGGLAVWFGFYVIIFLMSSIFSVEKTLALNEPKEFCGFYLDCHLHTAVLDVRKTKTIGGETANGEFYIVKVKVFSDARNPSIALHLLEPKAVVKSESGQVFTRSATAENLLPTAQTPLNQDVKTNSPFEKEIVFDLPPGAKNPRLDISEGYGIDKVIEAVLVGDEDSLWHKRQLFGIEPQMQTANLK